MCHWLCDINFSSNGNLKRLRQVFHTSSKVTLMISTSVKMYPWGNGVFTLPDTDTDFTFTDTGTDTDTMGFKPNCIVVGVGVGVGQCEHTIILQGMPDRFFDKDQLEFFHKLSTLQECQYYQLRSFWLCYSKLTISVKSTTLKCIFTLHNIIWCK